MTAEDKEFVIERYRYILEQKKFLNRTTFVIASIYQGGLSLIIAANYKFWSAAHESSLSGEVLAATGRGLILLLWALTLFSVAMLIAGVVSWRGYRQDEALIEDKYLGGRRPLPRIGGAFRWYETYVILGMLLVSIGFTIYLSRMGL